jgi:hypothetical protein
MDRRRRTSQVGDSVGVAVTKALALSLLVASAVSIVWKLLTFRRSHGEPSKA